MKEPEYYSQLNYCVDVHTHTIASGHAFCTLTEMIDAGREKGLKILGVTEHGPSLPGSINPMYFRNMYIVPREYDGMRLMMGCELNIIDYEGNIDLSDMYMPSLELRIAGLHGLCYKDGTKEQNTSALLGAIENPRVQIISHPGDGTASEFDIEAVVQASKKYGTLLEVNNSSLIPYRKKTLARPYNLELLRLCKKYECPIILGSDAHHKIYIKEYGNIYPLLAETEFPAELIVNTSAEKFLEILKVGK